MPMMSLNRALVIAALAVAPAGAALAGVSHQVTTVNGLAVDQYAWTDSQGLTRTVSLKQEGNGNPGHGGYAVQMTYQVPSGGAPATVTVNAETTGDGGFGYFVSHERYRTFTDGAYDTIAGHVFHKDDSPLGLGFPVVGTALTPADPTALAHRFTLSYHHYGTIAPIPKDADGNDVSPTPADPSQLALYQIPVTITWVFQSGTDYPRINTSVSLAKVGEPDRVNFDLRGPYGVMVFDNGADGTVQQVMWGDRYHFRTTQKPATRDSAWVWNGANAGARYTALIAGGYEMGLFEPVRFSHSALDDGYADERGSTSALYNHGKGCVGESQIIPCDWEWPYQSLQYSLPYVTKSDPNANHQPTNFKKIAWGSSAYYGTGPSLPAVWDSSTTSEPFVGYPPSGRIAYNICVVLGQTTSLGLTRQAAASPSRNCASAAP